MRFFSLIQFNCCFSLQRFLKIGVMTCLHDFEVFPLQQLNFKISTGKLFVKNDFARSILFKRGKSEPSSNFALLSEQFFKFINTTNFYCKCTFLGLTVQNRRQCRNVKLLKRQKARKSWALTTIIFE